MQRDQQIGAAMAPHDPVAQSPQQLRVTPGRDAVPRVCHGSPWAGDGDLHARRLPSARLGNRMRDSMDTLPLYLANRPSASSRTLEVRDKHSGALFARVARAGPAELERAIAAAHAARPAMARLPAWKRRDALAQLAMRCEAEREALARILCAEAGKPLVDSRGEVTRLIDTLRIAAEESTRIGGEWLPMDVNARCEGRWAVWKRVPIGACSFITPFNFPLNLAAHKLAPAIAAGCPFVLKPCGWELGSPSAICRRAPSRYCRWIRAKRAPWSKILGWRCSPSPDRLRWAGT
jgi:hypothetical protein